MSGSSKIRVSVAVGEVFHLVLKAGLACNDIVLICFMYKHTHTHTRVAVLGYLSSSYSL